MMLGPNIDRSLLEPGFRQALAGFLGDWNLRRPKYLVGVIEAFRVDGRQAVIYARGRTTPGEPCWHAGIARPVGTCPEHPLGAVATMSPPGFSWHEYGVAADVVFDAEPLKPGLQATWNPKLPWDDLGKCGQDHGLEWAGAWKRFREAPHFQRTLGVPLGHVQELKRIGGMSAVFEAFA